MRIEINLNYIPQKFKSAFASWIGAGRVVFFSTSIRLITLWSRASRAFVNFGIGITKLDSNISSQFSSKTDGLGEENMCVSVCYIGVFQKNPERNQVKVWENQNEADWNLNNKEHNIKISYCV